MNVLRSLEEKIAAVVEGAFGRVFRSEVQPIQIAHKLARELDRHRTISVSHTYVPNEYLVWLSPEDRARYDGVEDEVIGELATYLLEHARREELELISRPKITFNTDERLSLGEFGIQTRLVRPPSGGDGEPLQGEHGHTMIFSASDRQQESLASSRARALLVTDGRRLIVPSAGAVIGRSQECDIVLDDSNVSRRHAELRPRGGSWMIVDLGSTNGVRVNGRRTAAPTALAGGDRIDLGSTVLTFEES